MKQQTKAILVLVFGILFVLIGFASFLLPLVPGWLFLAMGLLLLSLYFPRLRNWIDARTERWPKLHKLVHRMREWADRNIGAL